MMGIAWTDHTSPSLARLVERDPIAILPLGSVEQHGHHLPVGTDSFAAETLARRAAERWSGEQPILVLPALWTGLSPHHMGLAGSITLRSETFVKVLEDVCASVLHHGVRRVLLLNGHGGNAAAMEVALTRLGERGLPSERVAGVSYWNLIVDRVREWRESPVGGTGHAGELETSLMLATHAHLVELDHASAYIPDLPSSYLSTDMFVGAPVRRYIAFDALSPTGTIGDPSTATRAKGERILQICVDELIDFLEDFAGW